LRGNVRDVLIKRKSELCVYVRERERERGEEEGIQKCEYSRSFIHRRIVRGDRVSVLG
jgi:hypothetical protein